MPVVQGNENQKVPPVVRVTKEVKLSGEPSFWYARNVDYKGKTGKEIHADDSGNKELQKKNTNYKEIMKK